MKTIQFVSVISIFFIIVYFISCDIIDKDNLTVNNTNSDIPQTEHLCPNPNGCNGVHFCLNYHTTDDEYLDPQTIYGIYVYQNGKDCADQDFVCNYYTELSTPYSMGTTLPIYNSYVTFTRRIVICCSGPYWTWEGSMTVNYYPGYTGLDILVHPTYKKC